MSYVKLSDSFIYNLRWAWNEYCDRLRRGVDTVVNRAMDAYVAEANADFRRSQYTAVSIKNWFEDVKRQVYSWAERQYNNIESNERICNKLIDQVASKRFYCYDSNYSDIGKRFLLNFLDCTFTYTFDSTISQFFFTAKGVIYEGDFDSYAFRENFTPPKVEFTPWFRE